MRERPLVRASDRVVARAVERATGTTIQVLLGPEEGMPSFYLRQFVIQPGGRIPAHRHPDIEHEQWVLEGEMELVLDGQPTAVRTGDCVYIPAGCAHAYTNRSTLPVRFLCAVPAVEGYATEWLDA